MTIMLDTPVVLKALGYNGATQRDAVLQTIALARDLKVTVACFDHTLREVDGVLDSVQGTLKSRGRNQGFRREVDAYFLDLRATAADVEIERSRLRENVQSIGVRVVPRPDDYYKYGLDEKKLEQHLQDVVGYRVETTRRYDVMSLSAVHRQRKGGCAEGFEKCGYVLITDNAHLAWAAKGVDERHNWPLAMTDADLSALLWVRSPASAADLPRQQLLATVHAGMQPSSHLWSRYLLEIERLQRDGKVDQDEALILRSRPEARRALMDVTLGATGVVDAEAVESVVDRVRDSLEAPIRSRIGLLEIERDDALQRAQATEVAASSAQTQADANLEVIRQELDGLRAANQSQRAALASRAQRNAGRYVSAVPALVGLTLIGFAAMQLANPRGPGWVSAIAVVAGVVFLFDEKIERWLGIDWRIGLGPTRKRLASRLTARYLRRAGLPDLEPQVVLPRGEPYPLDFTS
jgi:hypothetical protein